MAALLAKLLGAVLVVGTLNGVPAVNDLTPLGPVDDTLYAYA